METFTTTFTQNSLQLSQKPFFSSLNYPLSISKNPNFLNPNFPLFSKPKKPYLTINSCQISQSIAPINTQFKDKKNPFFSLIKTPLTIAIASTAIFFCGFGFHKPLSAIAEQSKVESFTQGDEEIDKEDVISKEKSLEEQLVINGNNVDALKALMEVKIKLKKLPEAVEVINSLIELEKDEVEWPLLRSHMYSYMGESELAKAGFEEIIGKDPARVEAFHGLVMAVSQGGDGEGNELEEVSKRVEEAMEKVKKANKVEEVRDFKLLVAQIRVIQGDYGEALKVYQELVKEEPRDFRPYLCQGIIYTLLRKKDEAEKQFDKYKRLVPKGHPYARFFDDNMLATKVFSQMAENERMNVGSKN